MRLSHSAHVDATPEEVRSFLHAHAQRSVDDADVVEVHQDGRRIRLTIRNTITPEQGGTRLTSDAVLQLRGVTWVVGKVFQRRVRRILSSSLSGLPGAIETARAGERSGGSAAGIVDAEEQAQEGAAMAEEQKGLPRELRDQPIATTVSPASQDREQEADPRIPGGSRENLEKLVDETAAGDGVVDSVKRAAHELDRTFGGEYERREDEQALERAREAGDHPGEAGQRE